MLTPTKRKSFRLERAEVAIVASRYNAQYVEAMVRAARSELKRAGATIRLERVPGAYEIPLVAMRLAREWRENKPSLPSETPPGFAIICLGVILRGETVHAAHIGETVSRALMEIQLRHEVPVIHEVLLLESQAQARARCLDRRHNRGAEAAQTALAMAKLMASFSNRTRT